jgi:5-methylcytosine-specific restriction endonuclease McrA
VLHPKESEVGILVNICDALTRGQVANASELLGEYSFKKSTIERKTIPYTMAVQVFVRDGFIDRYSGQRLIFPPVLRIVSERLGQELFPFHPHWKTECTHPAFWDLGATVDHFIPITMGGKHEKENLRTTSGTWNTVKSNCTLDDLGWRERQPPKDRDKAQWDGLLAWFLEYVEQNPEALKVKMVRRWYDAVFIAGREDLEVHSFLEKAGATRMS